MPSKLKEDLKLDIERFIKDHQDCHRRNYE